MSERPATQREFTGRPDRNPGEEHTIGYHVAQRVMRGEHQPSAKGGWRGLVLRASLALLVTVGLWISSPSVGLGQESLHGYVKAKTGTTIQIDSKSYRLHPQVTIRDEQGKPRQLKDLGFGSEVKVYLERGKVKQIILILND